MDKIALDLYDVVKRSHEIRVMLRNKGEIQCGTNLIYLFALDLMGRVSPAGRIFANKTDDTIKLSKSPVSSAFKIVCFLGIFVGDMLCCKYNCDYIRGRETNYIFFYVVLFITYVAVDCIFLESSKVFLVDFFLPMMVAPNARHAEMLITNTLEKIISDVNEEGKREQENKRRAVMDEADATFEKVLAQAGHNERDKNSDAKPTTELPVDTPPNPTFSTSDHMFVSTRVAKHFPGLFESAIILSYNEPLPFATALYWGQHVAHPKLDTPQREAHSRCR